MVELRHLVLGVSRLLNELGLEHCLIGGLAVAARGYPRATRDVDFLIAPPGPLAHVLERAQAMGLRLAPEDRELAEAGILFLSTEDATRVDLIVAEGEAELAMLRAAEAVYFGADAVPVMAVEDLIAMKLAAGRSRDEADAEALLERRPADFDVSRCLESAEALGVRAKAERFLLGGD